MSNPMTWAALSVEERLIAVSADAGRHIKFSLLAPVLMIGTAHIDDTLPTAATDGKDEWYNREFVAEMVREELRYLRYHEGGHKLLQHCNPMYRYYADKYPQQTNAAMDHVVNHMLEEMDNGDGFIMRPTKVPPLIDPKYKGWSFIQVLEDILKNQPPPPPGSGKGNPSGQGEGEGNGGFDEHRPSTRTGEQEEALSRIIKDAAVQGKMISDRLAHSAGKEGTGGKLPNDIVAGTTRWQEHLLDFLQQTVKGDEFSRFNPPNRRLQPLGILMPSHFSESMGDLVIAADTSGSMFSILGKVLGEIAHLCKLVNPDRVHLIWWDTQVCAVQTFTQSQYDGLAQALRPEGGGGTMPSCVTDWLLKHKEINPTAIVWLTDGDFYEAPHLLPKVPQIWGVIGSHPFTAPKGKVLRIPAI